VASTRAGRRLHLIIPASAAALVAAGLLSVIVFPVPGLRLLGSPTAISAAARRESGECAGGKWISAPGACRVGLIPKTRNSLTQQRPALDDRPTFTDP
jgi:hypothetical protein